MLLSEINGMTEAVSVSSLEEAMWIAKNSPIKINMESPERFANVAWETCGQEGLIIFFDGGQLMYGSARSLGKRTLIRASIFINNIDVYPIY